MADPRPCQGPTFGLPCTNMIDPATAHRFEDDTPAHREYLLCDVCCPNCNIDNPGELNRE